jgi:hypothetical protein
MGAGARSALRLLAAAFVAAASPLLLDAQYRGDASQLWEAPVEMSPGWLGEGVALKGHRRRAPMTQATQAKSKPNLWRAFDRPVDMPQAVEDGPGIALPAILSAVLPGAGQHVLGQKRRWIYIGLEAAGWIAYVNRRSAGADATDVYRDFAWDQARLQSEPRMDGDFDYYETLTKWGQSGAFDQDPAQAGIQPERDAATFNGSIWSLASSLFLGGTPGAAPTDPQYERALAYYEERAYNSAFLWEWQELGDDQDSYGSLITDSDEKYRQATNVLGAIIANHFVSAVDAFVSARGIVRGTQSEVVPMFTPEGTRWHTRVRVPTRW